MIRKADDCAVFVRNAMRNGQGSVILTEIVNRTEMFDKVRLFEVVTLKPGCSIGYHEHYGECEIFYIMSGKAVYNDDGQEAEVIPGDVTLVENGHGHGIRNDGNTEVKLISLIVLR